MYPIILLDLFTQTSTLFQLPHAVKQDAAQNSVECEDVTPSTVFLCI